MSKRKDKKGPIQDRIDLRLAMTELLTFDEYLSVLETGKLPRPRPKLTLIKGGLG